MPTTDELQAELDILKIQIAQMVTKHTWQVVVDMLATYKEDTDAMLADLGERITALEAEVHDLKIAVTE